MARTTKTVAQFSVLLICLDRESFFDAMFSDLLAKLRAKSYVVKATCEKHALDHLADPAYMVVGVYVTEPSIMEAKHKSLARLLTMYLRAGGTIVLGGICSGMGKPSDFDQFFEKTLGVPWRVGSCNRSAYLLNHTSDLYRTDLEISDDDANDDGDWYEEYDVDGKVIMVERHEVKAMDAVHEARMLERCSLKALHLKNVIERERIYIPAEEGSDRSVNETPIAFGSVHNGCLGWIGSINADKALTNVTMKMLDL